MGVGRLSERVGWAKGGTYLGTYPRHRTVRACTCMRRACGSRVAASSRPLRCSVPLLLCGRGWLPL
eukprot:3603742-Pleurochrysis_carterae.AAC.1